MDAGSELAEFIITPEILRVFAVNRQGINSDNF
jgi:hypothetical protein